MTLIKAPLPALWLGRPRAAVPPPLDRPRPKGV